MINPTRRSLLRGSAAVVAAGTLARPYIANAAAKTATVWWVQGFAQEEDVAFKKIVADYEKASGNTIDFSLVPYAPHRQKVVSAMTSGEVPDLFPANPAEIGALFAWQGKLVDVSDVVETQKAQYSETALLSAQFYNNATKQRGVYGVPTTGATLPFHIWNSLVEKAGYKLSDAPKTWDAFWDFFKPVQDKLRAQGMRNVYALGLQVIGQRRRSQYLVQLFSDCQWRPGYPHQGRPAASRRSEGQRGGDQGADLSGQPPTKTAMCRRARSTGTTPTTTTPSTPS